MRKLDTKTIVVASHNAGKIREIEDLIGPFGFSAKSAAELKFEEPDETGTTFEENATIKALASATRAGPAWFGLLDRYGAVAAGKAADLVLLDANPLEDIRATRAIRMVMLRGAVEDRAALDRILADTRAKVAAWNAAEAK